VLQAAVDKHKHKADRYRKTFKTLPHAWILILHFMKGAATGGPGTKGGAKGKDRGKGNGGKGKGGGRVKGSSAGGGGSLRQTHAEFGANPTLRRRLGLDEEWISFSQLARSSTTRAPDCFEELVIQVLRLAQSQAKPIDDPQWKLLNKAKAIDSTFLGLSAKLSPWSVYGGHAPGVRVQFGLDLASHIPEVLHLHGTDVLDNKALGLMCEADLAPFAGWTLVIDLGYYGHKQFERLIEWNIHFLSKIHPQAKYEVTVQREVSQKPGWTPQDDEVLADEVITLGSPNNRRGAVLPQMRMVTSRSPRPNSKGEEQICRLITDRHDLQAWEVVALYRKRWQIELFFRWLKRQLGVIQPLGYSQEAVWLTVLVGSLVALLWALMEGWDWGHKPAGMTRICWLRAIAVTVQSMIRLSG
jgi:hypothetical protein